jgi:hypothetical protein
VARESEFARTRVVARESEFARTRVVARESQFARTRVVARESRVRAGDIGSCCSFCGGNAALLVWSIEGGLVNSIEV